MNRIHILKEAERLTTGDRHEAYGEPIVNMTRIAEFWSIYLGVKIRPDQVPIMNNLQKIARLMESPDAVDSNIDGAAYMAIAGEVAHILKVRKLTEQGLLHD